MSKKLISIVFLLAIPALFADYAATIITGDNTLVRTNSHTATLVSGLIQSSLAQPDFSLSAMPFLQTTTPGNGVNYSMKIAFMTEVTGFFGNTALSLNGLPVGATGTFIPNPVQGFGFVNPVSSYVEHHPRRQLSSYHHSHHGTDHSRRRGHISGSSGKHVLCCQPLSRWVLSW